LTSGFRTIGVASFAAAVAFAFYATPLSQAAPSPGETALLQQVARLDEAPLPLFFHVSGEQWLQPIPVYLTAFIGIIAPADAAARYATAALGALDVVLIFVLARRLFQNRLIPYGAALLLLVTPAHFVYARLGTEAIYLLPFIFIWLICLVDYLRDGRAVHAAGGAFALGVGVYTQPAAPLTMTFLLLVSLAAMGLAGRLNLRTAAPSVAAFSLPLLLAAGWFATHPESYPDTFGRWAIHAAHLRFPLDAVRAFINWTTLGTRASLYWGFFDPSWLFFDRPAAGPALRGSAPFLLATVVLMVPGVRWALAQAPSGVTALLLGGLAVSPLAASTFGEPHAIESGMAVVPFMLVLAIAGAVTALTHDRRTWRVIAWGALAACAVDFASFYVAYWG